jgi:hypothetical protein
MRATDLKRPAPATRGGNHDLHDRDVRAEQRLAPMHNRMPVILEPADYDRWLDASQPDGQALLRPCPDEWLEAHPISTRVNNVRNDDEELMRRFRIGRLVRLRRARDAKNPPLVGASRGR